MARNRLQSTLHGAITKYHKEALPMKHIIVATLDQFTESIRPREMKQIAQIFRVHMICGASNFAFGGVVLAEYKNYTTFQIASIPVSLM